MKREINYMGKAVTHPSTNRAQRCLTSVIGREPVFSTACPRHKVNVYGHITLKTPVLVRSPKLSNVER
ncbi:hypothetical protein B566_EDAN018941, partial [Ephemera danica]